MNENFYGLTPKRLEKLRKALEESGGEGINISDVFDSSMPQNYAFLAREKLLHIEEFDSDEEAKEYGIKLANKLQLATDIYKLNHLESIKPTSTNEETEDSKIQLSNIVDYFCKTRLPLLHAAYLLNFGCCQPVHKIIKNEKLHAHLFWFEPSETPSPLELQMLSATRFELEDKANLYRLLCNIPANEAAFYFGAEDTQVKGMYVRINDYRDKFI